MTDRSNQVRAFHDGVTTKHKCLKGPLKERGTIEHCILRIPERLTTKRRIFRVLESTTLETLCRKQPTEILEFMHNEGIFHEAPTQSLAKKKKKIPTDLNAIIESNDLS